MSELWKLDGVEIARLVRGRQVSCREVTDQVLARLDAVNPAINAVVRPLHEEARAAADAADKAVQRGDALRPLHGVPVTTKVNVDQEGLPTDNGVVEFRNLIAPRDSPTIANMRSAGGIIVGRTNTPCFSMRWFTDNALHGLTLNPWARARTAGGSSGGAAAATASGIGTIGQGNDIAGSVRYPAYCCGLVGLRPTYGRIPAFNYTGTSHRVISAALFAVQGPLTRTVRDARLALQAMMVPHASDPRCVGLPFEGPPPARPIRVAMMPNPAGRGGVAPEIDAAIRQAGKWLADAGYAVEEIDPPCVAEAIDLWGKVCMDDTIAALEPLVAKYGDAEIRTALSYWRAYFPKRDAASVLEGLAERDTVLRQWELFQQSHPLVLTCVSGELPFKVGEDVESAATAARLIRAQSMQLAVPVLGLPAVSVPTGTSGGVPVGVQIIGPRYREDLCLAAAEAIEQSAGASRLPVDPFAS